MTMVYPPFLTASAVDLFDICAGSAVYVKTSESNAAATRGTASHAEVLQPGQLPQIFVDWFGREPRFEVALGWNPATGEARHLGDNMDRGYELPSPNWLSGTADAPAVDGDVISVGDLKTGYHQTRGALGDPRKSGQLRLLAWILWQLIAARKAAAASTRRPECWTSSGAPSWCTTHARRIVECSRSMNPSWKPSRIRLAWLMRPEGEDPFIEDGEIEPDELRAWAIGLAKRAELARNGTPSVVPGPHCTSCHAFDGCPAQGQALRRLSELPGDGPITDEDAAMAYFAVAMAEKLVERGKKALTAYVTRRDAEAKATGGVGDVPLGGDRVLRLIRARPRTINALAALNSGLIPPTAAKLSVTQSSIRDALPPSRGLDNVVEGIMKQLEDIGAVTRTETAPYAKMIRRGSAEK